MVAKKQGFDQLIANVFRKAGFIAAEAISESQNCAHAFVTPTTSELEARKRLMKTI